MKTSFLTALSFSVLAVACSTNDDVLIPPHVDQTPAEQPPVVTKRTLTTGGQLNTSPVNFVVDSGFAMVDQQQPFGWFVFDNADQSLQVTLTSKLDSRSPAGFGGGVGMVMAPDATDKKSDAIILLSGFPGGAGPYKAQVWISKSNIAGKAVDFDLDPKEFTASIADSTVGGDAYDLAFVPESTRKVGDRTWALLRGTFSQPLTYGGFFMLQTGERGGQWQIAAPELVAQPLVEGIATRSLVTSARSRAKTAAELRAIAKQRSIKPLRVPASVKAPRL